MAEDFACGDGRGGGTSSGRYPAPAMGDPDGAGDDVQWIPTTAIEQLGATPAKWFGVPTVSFPQVFPDLQAFAARSLGFLVRKCGTRAGRSIRMA
jgi:hypothetical protein